MPANSLQKTCSVPCAIEMGQKTVAKRQKEAKRKERAKIRERKERLKTRGDYIREAQRDFNAWIRERDHDQPCISCGKPAEYGGGSGVYWHAGHYRTTKAAPELRFEPLNVHKQCSQCNNHDSGNILEYRIGLIKRIGQGKVDWLEGPHEPKKLTIEEIRAIGKTYRQKARELKKERGQ